MRLITFQRDPQEVCSRQESSFLLLFHLCNLGALLTSVAAWAHGYRCFERMAWSEFWGWTEATSTLPGLSSPKSATALWISASRSTSLGILISPCVWKSRNTCRRKAGGTSSDISSILHPSF